ncbi:MAG: ATP-binding protein [Euryarchaeota archaeon]|nr:ATP-binding protein [Euryarchaeota archaeon]
MISNIEIENFKCFGEGENGGALSNLGRVNVIYGANNSGKSSILHAICLLKQSLNKSILTFSGASNLLVDLNSFEESVFNKQRDKRIRIRIGFKLTDGIEKLNKIAKQTPYQKYDFTSVNLTVNAIADRILSETLSTKEGVICELYFDKGRSEYKMRYSPEIIKEDFVNNSFAFLGWRASEPKETPYCADISKELRDSILDKMNRIYFLSAYRRIVLREQSISREPDEVNNGADTLAYFQYIRNNRPDAFSKIVEHTKNFNIADLTTVLSKGESSASFKDDKLPISTSIMDIGFGTNQIFSVIVQCFGSPANSTIMIEEPEIHLHPLAQSNLLDLFLDATKDGAKQVIITTHSTKLLDKIREGAGSKFKENEVKVFEVTKEQKGCVVTPIPPKSIRLGEEFGY